MPETHDKKVQTNPQNFQNLGFVANPDLRALGGWAPGLRCDDKSAHLPEAGVRGAHHLMLMHYAGSQLPLGVAHMQEGAAGSPCVLAPWYRFLH